jgi:hypothetical protein
LFKNIGPQNKPAVKATAVETGNAENTFSKTPFVHVLILTTGRF